jgi:hypothetical protein
MSDELEHFNDDTRPMMVMLMILNNIKAYKYNMHVMETWVFCIKGWMCHGYVALLIA